MRPLTAVTLAHPHCPLTGHIYCYHNITIVTVQWRKKVNMLLASSIANKTQSDFVAFCKSIQTNKQSQKKTRQCQCLNLPSFGITEVNNLRADSLQKKTSSSTVSFHTVHKHTEVTWLRTLVLDQQEVASSDSAAGLTGHSGEAWSGSLLGCWKVCVQVKCANIHRGLKKRQGEKRWNKFLLAESLVPLYSVHVFFFKDGSLNSQECHGISVHLKKLLRGDNKSEIRRALNGHLDHETTMTLRWGRFDPVDLA